MKGMFRYEASISRHCRRRGISIALRLVLRSRLQISICMPTLVHPNVVFQIAQPTFIIIDESLSIFAIRESYQIAVPCLVKADDSGKSSHLRHFQQGVVVIFGGADVQVHRRNPRVCAVPLLQHDTAE